MKITISMEDIPTNSLTDLACCAVQVVSRVEADPAIRYIMCPICKPAHIHIAYSGLAAHASVLNSQQAELFSFGLCAVNEEEWRLQGEEDDLKPKVFAGMRRILDAVIASIGNKEDCR